MEQTALFLSKLTKEEKKFFQNLDSPFKIQAFLDTVVYPGEEGNRSPIDVMRLKKAHCFDGGLFAAAALRLLGFDPIIVDLLPEPGKDDDHILALFKINGCLGAVAKSNFSGLRYREPIHRTLRELVMTYFEDFFNMKSEKTMRSYSRPVHLKRFDRLNWMTDVEGLNAIEKHLYKLPTIPVITPEQAGHLSLEDKRSFDAGTIGLNYDGVYKLN
jgi:hypothetical protein